MSEASKLETLQRSIQNELDQLKQEEEALFQEMSNMLAQKPFLDSKIASLSKLLPTLKIVKHETEALVTTINDISASSENISGKIRSLDSARSRVNECQQRVSDLIDLEVCSQGVQTAILDSDYETGAGHVHRFLSIDQSLLQRTATDMENVTGMLKSVRTLQDAASQLRAIVAHKFAAAVAADDLPAIERFFKIFPLLGMHADGIKQFGGYLRTKVAAAGDQNVKAALSTPLSDKRHAVVFADALTLLFEGVARALEAHQPLIETFYGPGRLLPAVEALQQECDAQMRRIVHEWGKARQIGKKIATIAELSRASPAAGFAKIDPKDLDILIGEITLMHYRAELYVRFIRRKIGQDLEAGGRGAADAPVLDELVKNSDLVQLKHELLSHYLRLEQYFMEESVAKAVAMDAVEQGQPTSSMVDDAFFIIKKCIRRSISGASLDGICAIINTACRVLENDYCDVIRSRLRQGYPSGYLDLTQAYNVLQTSIQQGRLQASDSEQARNAFLVAWNNADLSGEYVEALCDNVMKEIEGALPSLNANERGKLESCLSGLSSVTINLKEVIEYGVQQLRVSAIKPRINPWVDHFNTFSHQLAEEELSAYEAGESFVQTLIVNLDTFLSSFKDLLTPANNEAFISALTGEVVQRFEKVVLKSSYNRLGGLVLDKEVRSLAGYITSSTSWSVRDKFARLTQIATVLNLEQANEILDYWGEHDGALTWRLTPSEIRSILALRVDFKSEEIKRIKL